MARSKWLLWPTPQAEEAQALQDADDQAQADADNQAKADAKARVVENKRRLADYERTGGQSARDETARQRADLVRRNANKPVKKTKQIRALTADQYGRVDQNSESTKLLERGKAGPRHALIACYGRHHRPATRSNWRLWPTPQASVPL